MGHIEKLMAIENARTNIGVDSFASPAEIRENWARRANALRHAQEEAEAKLKALNEAYELLQPAGSVRLLNPNADANAVQVHRPISKQPEEISHVRPTMLGRVNSREVNPFLELFKTEEEDEKTAQNVRNILGLQ